ncbi:beta-ketoacyl synthase domain-containing protein [Thozetella sp. PMI_491]|nr:beta-ketoacyl synthase domain-containing protein [Thozetella sp. PMI_491]
MDEPIAIVGLDARLPGDGDTAERFYESLLAGRSARGPIPSERYNVDAFWHPDGERGGATRAKYAHFLRGSVAAFDAPFFSITPAEASNMDPQQRGMLESVYKALENAGIPLAAAAGSQTGVYVGCFSSDYHDITIKDLDIPSKYAATGTVASMLSNRVSWFFDFRGPSVTIDTACSSSLVAAHEACMSLKLREVSMAIVGGCNLMLSPEMTLNLDSAGVLGPDGKSYSFDHRGNGYARGEGFGVLVLKRVSDAIRDGDVIRAVIRNSSTNSDGRSPGITQPTKRAQAALIKHVYAKAGLDPSVTRFFEAHGTGTAIGDPIEASAIAEMFASHRSPEEPLYVGALKSNVGHLEGAAGVAGLIKGVFTLESGIIPPNIWFEKRNPKIEDSWNLKFPTEATAWPQSGVRRMSINSFGVGGSNAHVVMDDAFHFLQTHRLVGNHRTEAVPARAKLLNTPASSTNGVLATNGKFRPNGTGVESSETESDQSPTSPTQLFVLSSYDQEGVTRVRDAYATYIDSKDATCESQFLSDLAYTLGPKRTHHSWRSFVLAHSHSSLRAALTQMPKPVRIRSDPRLAFVFTGQGAQWPAMGMELMALPAFQQSLLAADNYLNELGSPWTLTYELSKGADNSRVNDPEFSQPLCTALQVALVDLLATWNIRPLAVTGHSSGEVAAAYAAGAISREAAWKVSYYRGKLSAKLSRAESKPTSGMAAVGLNLEETRAAIDRINALEGDGSLEIACYNSWNSYTISGDIKKIETLAETLTEEKKFARKLNVQLAYHSQYMKAIADEYLAAMGELEHGAAVGGADAGPAFFSSTVGGLVSLDRLRDPAYWVENLVSPVRFCDSVTALVKGSQKATDRFLASAPTNVTDILELGPHSALKGPLTNITKVAGKSDIQYHSAIIRKRSAIETILETAGSLYSSGFNVDLGAVNQASGVSPKPLLLTDLPGYAFNHSKEYWIEGKPSRDFRLRPAPRHELLGAPVNDWNRDNAVWRNYIRLSENPWIEDHKVAGEILYPAAGMLVMAVEASRQLADSEKVLKGFKFRDVSFHAALRVPEDTLGVESHFYLQPSAQPQWSEFRVSTFQEGEWIEHCRGLVQTEYESDSQSGEQSLEDQLVKEGSDRSIKRAQEICSRKVVTEKLYQNFKQSGLNFGPTFQSLSDVRLGPDLQIFGQVDSTVPKIKKAMPYEYIMPHLVHPAMLDGVVHANLVPLVLGPGGATEARVPVFARDLWISASPHTAHDSYLVTAQPKACGRQEFVSSVTAVEASSGRPMVYASDLVFKTLPGSQVAQSADHKNSYNIEWQPDPTLLTAEQAASVFALPMTAADDPASWMDDCETLCLAYIRRFLASVQDGISSVDKMDWHHKRYISWFQHTVGNSPSASTPTDAEIAEIEQRVANGGSPEGVLITAVGRALPDMLGGPLDPLEVVFKDEIAKNVYSDGLGAKRCYAQLCAYVDALAHKNPALQILEIGAGTGGATRPVVETLTRKGRRYAHYEFTDISPSFFEEARETFSGELSFMNFRVLNVENDPSDQGFEEAKYDLVIAANVLHATKNIDVSLSHARKLLKPGGKILLYEITNLEKLLSTFCFGVLPGWWLSEDKDRVWGPLMTPESWRSHLTFSGFGGLDGVFHDFPGSPGQMTSIMVSTVPKPNALGEIKTIYILTDESSPFQSDVAAKLVDALGKNVKAEALPFTSIGEKELSEATVIVVPELEAPVLQKMTEDSFRSLQSIVTKSKSLLWLTRGGNAASPSPDVELVTGLARAARLERAEGFKFGSVAFEQEAAAELISHSAVQALAAVQEGSDNSFRVVNGLFYISRLVKADYLSAHIRSQTSVLSAVQMTLEETSDRRLELQVGTAGQLDDLAFAEDALAEVALADDEIEFETKATGLSVRDLAFALGKADEAPLGFEAAGVVTNAGPTSKFAVGDRVFGLSLSGTLKTVVRTHEGLVAKIPGPVSFSEAASLPVAFSTAHAVLYESGSINKGDTVLIHAATSAVGQAAVQLAQLQGAEVFVTTHSSEQRAVLETTYGIPSDHIFSYQDSSFKIGIKNLTLGRGVDVVLDNLSDTRDAAARDNLDLVAPFGRYIQIGSASSIHASIPAHVLARNIRIESFDLLFRATHDPVRTRARFQRAMDVLAHPDFNLRQINPAVYPFSQLQDALRQLQTSKDVESVILEPRLDDVVPVIPSRAPETEFDPAASYVVAGGLGGLGRSIARWMASRGAKNLILLSRSGPITEAAKELISELEGKNVKVSAPSCDVTDLEVLKKAISDSLESMPPIKGCVQGSMVLKDNRLEDMSADEWNAAVRSKVDSSWNLHSVLGSNLDFLILLSSTVGITGNPEQSNYAAAGTFQDTLARHLTAQGTNTFSFDLPVILGVGFVAEKPELMDYMRSTGWAYMEEAEFHATLDYHCRPRRQDVPISQSQVIPRFWLPQETAAEGYTLPSWRLDPLFSHLTQTQGAAADDSKATATKDINHAALLVAAASPEEAEKIVLDAVLLKLSRVLSVDLSNLDPARPLHSYGVDSLVAVDLRAWLSKQMGADVSVFDMTNKGSILQLVSTITARSKLTPLFGKEA